VNRESRREEASAGGTTGQYNGACVPFMADTIRGTRLAPASHFLASLRVVSAEPAASLHVVWSLSPVALRVFSHRRHCLIELPAALHQPAYMR